jgi:hypothetical protein
MASDNSQGTCDRCGQVFPYQLIHNGFNESCYAYCAGCGMTAIIDTLYKDRGWEGLPRHRCIFTAAEKLLAPCRCGASFTARASPRCPHCHEELSPVAAATWIEANDRARTKVTNNVPRWQRNWHGLYAIVINGRVVKNPWLVPA